MSQQDIYKYMRKHRGEKFTAKFFDKKFNFGNSNTNLLNLWKNKDIERKLSKEKHYRTYVYWIKR